MKDAPTLEFPMSLSASSSFYSPVTARLRVPGLTVTLLRQDAGRRLPPHGHPTAYFSFLLSGSYEERLGSRRLDHRVPSVVYHPPALEHRDAYGPEGGRILSIEVDAGRLARWGPPGADTAQPREVRGEGVLAAAWALCRAAAGPAPPLTLTVEDHAARLVERLGAGTPTAAERLPPRWLGQVVERLRAEYAAPPTMTDLARESGVHPAHLSRTFRRHLGGSPTAFVQRLRVEHAWARLVGDEPPPLADLALEAGFSDQPALTRAFKRFVGSPPGAFRTAVGELDAAPAD